MRKRPLSLPATAPGRCVTYTSHACSSGSSPRIPRPASCASSTSSCTQRSNRSTRWVTQPLPPSLTLRRPPLLLFLHYWWTFSKNGQSLHTLTEDLFFFFIYLILIGVGRELHFVTVHPWAASITTITTVVQLPKNSSVLNESLCNIRAKFLLLNP